MEGTFIYKLFDKRDSFLFLIEKTPHIESNIPQNIFCSAINGEFLRNPCSALYHRDFIPNTKEISRFQT